MHLSAHQHFSTEQLIALQRARHTLDEVAAGLLPAARALREISDAVPWTSRGLRALHEEVSAHLATLDGFRVERSALREQLHG